MRVHLGLNIFLEKPELLHPCRVLHPDKQSALLKGAWERLLGDRSTDNLGPFLLKTPTNKALREVRLAILQEPL